MPKCLALWLTLLLFALAASPSYSKSPENTLTIAVIDDVPSTLLAVQVLQEAYAKLGIEMKTTTIPSRRALFMANKGLLDGDLFRIEEVGSQYPDLVRVPYPLLQGQLVTVASGNRAEPISQGDSQPLTVAIRRGVIIAEMTAEQLGMRPILAKNYQQMRTLLDLGRVDLMLVSNIEGLSPLNKSDWGDLKILPETVVHFTLYHYLHRRHIDLAVPLSDTLREMDISGEISRITQDARLNHSW